MAFPPPTLPTNRTNATPQNDTHPGDHNAVNAAMNDTVGRVITHGTRLDGLDASVVALRDEQARAYGGSNLGVTVLPPGGVWTVKQVLVFTAHRTGQFLFLVQAQVWPGATGGRVSLICGLDGVMLGSAPSITDCSAGDAPSMTSMYLHGGVTPGSHSLDCFGWTNGTGGNITQATGMAMFIRNV